MKKPSPLSTQEREQRLAALGVLIAEKRDEAIAARSSSGIEETWSACEDAYLGIDDNNRYEYAHAKWAKPTSLTGPIMMARADTQDTRSTVFIRMTARYVDSGAARACELVLPIDDKAFSIKPLPDPELVKQKGDLSPMLHPNGKTMVRPLAPEEANPTAPSAVPGQPPVVDPNAPPAPQPNGPALTTMTKGDWYEQQTEKAQDAAEKAERRIYGWMVQSKYPAEARKVWHDAARIGAGVLKGPFPESKKSVAVTRPEQGAIAIQVNRKVVPAMRWTDPWNIFPDPACGEDIHQGNYICERDFMTERAIRDLRGQGYLQDSIKKVLKEGPGKCLMSGTNPAETKHKARFEVWYFYGDVKRRQLESAGAAGLDDIPLDQEDVPALIMLINDTVIKAALNPLDSGAFPYNVMSWSRRAGHWAGIGIAEQIAAPQRICNAATRAMLNNAGKSAGSQIVVDRTCIEPADGNWTMTPDKVWYLLSDSTMDDVRKAFMAVNIPNVGDQIMKIIVYAFKQAEELSNIPLMAQGHDSGNMPETFGAAEILNTNAQTLLRSIALMYDDNVTEPLVRNLYEWLLLDPGVPDEEKGDFEINAQGSIALVERAIQEQTLQIIGQMVANPAFAIDPKEWFAEFMRSKRLDPRKMQYTPEQQAKMAAQPAPPPVQVAVAQVRAQSAEGIQQSKAQTALQVEEARAQAALQLEQQDMAREQQNLQNGQATPHMAAASARIEEARIRASAAQSVEAARGQTELEYAQTEAQMARDNAQMRIRELELKERLAMLDYANKRNMSLDQIKADLAQSQMDNATKLQLAGAQNALHAAEGRNDRTHDLVKHVTAQNAETVDNQQERSHDMVKHTMQLEAAKEQAPDDQSAD